MLSLCCFGACHVSVAVLSFDPPGTSSADLASHLREPEKQTSRRANQQGTITTVTGTAFPVKQGRKLSAKVLGESGNMRRLETALRDAKPRLRSCDPSRRSSEFLLVLLSSGILHHNHHETRLAVMPEMHT